MERVVLSDGLSVSRIVYGMWRLADRNDRSPEEVRAKVDACLSQGITTFDQADVYGDYESEALFGTALKADPSLRGRMEIITKCGINLVTNKVPDRRVKHYDLTREHIFSRVEASLANMGIEQIDLLLLHRPDPLMDPAQTGRALDDLVASGKVGAVGVSNFLPHQFRLLQAHTEARFVTNQIEVSLLRLAPLVNDELAYLQECGLAPMAWSPLGGGALFERAALMERLTAVGDAQGVDATAVAVAWLLKHPARLIPVVGTNALERVKRLGDAMTVELDRQTWFELYEAALGQEVP